MFESARVRKTALGRVCCIVFLISILLGSCAGSLQEPQPAQPSESGEPTQPAQPIGSNEPAQPDQPTGSSASAQPAQPPQSPGGGHAKLIVEDRANVAWMTSNNRVANGGVDEVTPSNPAGDLLRKAWGGILFHVGEYSDPTSTEPPPPRYKGIKIEGPTVPGGEKEFLVTDGFFWVNVVSDSPPTGPPAIDVSPLDPSHAFELYKNQNNTNDPAGVNCRPDPTCPCTCTGSFSRSLHPWLDLKAVLTYWHGPGGYKSTVNRINPGDSEHRNTLKFDLMNKVTVSVYKENKTATSLTWDPPETYGQVLKITIMRSPTITFQHGELLDPPWP